MHVVLGKQPLVGGRTGVIRLRIAPAIEQVAAFPATSPRVTSSFRDGGTVIDSPEFVEAQHAESDLVELGVVGNRVDMGPFRVGAFLFPGGRRSEIAQG